jgi:sulfide:quinone oxidoreductase
MSTSPERRSRVLIVGGGIAGLEALMALRDMAGDRVDLTLAAPDPDFTYRPLLVEEPFSHTPAERRALDPIVSEFGGRFVQKAAERVDAEGHEAVLSGGDRIPYDMLVVCVGARPRPAYRSGITFLSTGEPLQIDGILGEVGDDGSSRIAFVVPPGVTWTLPIYELALMTKRRADSVGPRDLTCVVVTPESVPLAIFGSAASGEVEALLRARHIEVQTSTYAHEEGEELRLTPGDRRLEADRIIALPMLQGPGIPGLPADQSGFIPIDDHARVPGAEDVYAAGDGTTFPIKQGGLATQQADAAAEHIAARVGAEIEPHPFHPVLRGKLLTGEESLHMRHDIAGGTGEGATALDYLWWPPHKVSGRYLAAWLAEEGVHAEPEPPRHPLDVEVALPKEWHREPMALDPYETPDVD